MKIDLHDKRITFNRSMLRITVLISMILSLIILFESALTEDAVSAVRPRYGGTLKIAIGAEPQTLDPVQTMYPEEFMILMNTANVLVSSHGDQIVPDLAGTWDKSEDGRNFKIGLNPGIMFHSGGKCDAQAVIGSFERLRNSRYDWIMENVESMTAVTSTTVSIQLKTPDQGFLSLLTLIPTAIVKPGDILREKYPATTGPFQVTYWRRHQQIVLNENPYYYKGAPFLEELVVEILPDIDNHYREYQLGKIDLFFSTIETQQQVSPEFLKQNNLETQDRFSTVLVGINPKAPALRDNRLRKKIAAAIDKESILKTILKDQGKIARSLFPGAHLSLPGLHEEEQTADEPAGTTLLDLDQPLTMEMILPSSPRILTQVAARIKVNLMDLGIILKTLVLDQETYRRRFEEGNYDLCYYQWVPPSNDPFAALLSFLFSNPLMINFYRSHPQIKQELIDFKLKIAAMSDKDTRKVNISLFQKSVLNFVPVIPLYHERISVTCRTIYRNLIIEPRGFVLFEDLWITPARIMNKMDADTPEGPQAGSEITGAGSP